MLPFSDEQHPHQQQKQPQQRQLFWQLAGKLAACTWVPITTSSAGWCRAAGVTAAAAAVTVLQAGAPIDPVQLATGES
jgi:hypothetical protein